MKTLRDDTPPPPLLGFEGITKLILKKIEVQNSLPPFPLPPFLLPPAATPQINVNKKIAV
jgi:hypothetical protein